MKKLLLISLISLMIFKAQAQNLHLQKALEQNNTGLSIALGGTMIYSIASISRDQSYDKTDRKVFKVAMYTGLGIAAAGVVISSLSWRYVIKANKELLIDFNPSEAKIALNF
jgi:hypothetical protein